MAADQKTGGEAGGFKSILFAAVGTCCLGLPAGYFLADFAAPLDIKKSTAIGSTEETVAAEQTSDQSEAASVEAGSEVIKGPFEIVLLPPIITNIADPPKVWVRLEGNLLFDTSREANTAVLSAKLAQHVMAYLNTLKLSDLQGAGAVHGISQDLNEIVKSLSDGQVQGLLLSGLVFE